ncbi:MULTISPECIES: hypothetical protein [Brucella/Ochrobactrum group]|uniref:hypothetical protein n=1 Tax=Ochrobactrum sp. BTU2 TaxID=2856166 RepID=UPI002119CECA|nr:MULTISPECIES: hypothetical protein [Brucella/Ochrobactrum group]MCQ9148346.1 hypothetical protein [Ochrobactrum sp. BTU2]
MTRFLSKLVRVSDNATFHDILSFWTVVAFILGVMFFAQVAAIAVMIVRAG